MRHLLRKHAMPRVIAARGGWLDLGRFGAWVFRGDSFVHGEQLVRKLEHRVRRRGVDVHVTLRKVDGRVVGLSSRPVKDEDGPPSRLPSSA